MQYIYTAIASLGGSALIAVAVIKWLSNLLQNKLTLNWDQANKKELEMLKANLSSSQEIVRLSLSSLGSSNQIVMSKRLEAVEFIWKLILEIRDYISPIRTFYSVLLPSEYTDVINEKKDPFLFSGMTQEKHMAIMKAPAEHFRPYLGEYIWSLFFSYRAFILRIHFLFESGRGKGNIRPWYEDGALLGIIQNSIGEDQYKQLNLKDLNSLNNAISAFEQKILIETNKLISGSYNTEQNFYEAKRLMNIVMKEISGR